MIALLFNDTFNAIFGAGKFIGFNFLFTGCILLYADSRIAGRKKIRNMSIFDALVVGAMQGVAILPAVSRSGMTISTCLARGMNREEAARFSFLLSIPAILGANILSIADALEAGVNWAELPMYLVGVAVAAVSGYLCIRLLKMIADKGKFGFFAYYCWAVGVLTLVLNVIK